MTDQRSAFRRAAGAVIRRVLTRAIENGLDARAQRRALRKAYRAFLNATSAPVGKSPMAIWHRAVRDVTGSGVLSLVDPRQQPLPIEVGPRRPRSGSRRKDSRRAR